MEPGSQKWIAKPSVTNQAIGICVFDRVEGLREAVERNPDLQEWVLQRYIERPLLVEGRKFHIRAYALCVGSLQCYVYSEMLALFASSKYPMDGGDLTNLDAHLTNTCRLESEAPANRETDAVRLLSELPQILAQERLLDIQQAADRIEQVCKDVYEIIGLCMAAVSAELTFFTLPNCFELFGFDLLVDDSWNVWLLEANAEPDFRQTGQRLQGVVKGLIEGVVKIVADPLAEQLGHPLPNLDSQKSDGEWLKVFDQEQRGINVGSSGMKMHT